MLRGYACISWILVLASCQNLKPPSDQSFEPNVDEQLIPRTTGIEVKGKAESVGSSRDVSGIQSDFVVGVVRVRTLTQDQLNQFLSRYGGTVIADNALPEPPAGSGITLTDEQRQPTEFVVRIDLAKVDVSKFAANAEALGVTGAMEFSSQAALQTIAAVLDAVVDGFRASADYLLYPEQVFPMPLLATQEGTDAVNAFDVSAFGASGSESNVTQAWQFIAAHGINRRVKVAIVDSGFWLDPQGTAMIPDTDFPLLPTPIAQRDLVNNDDIASGTHCREDGPRNLCWHGTQMAGVAAGLLNNSGGVAGTGGQVGDLILLRFDLSLSQFRAAVRQAVAMGADIISISYSYDCDDVCRIEDREDTPFDDAVNAGSKTVFIAAAGNRNHEVSEPNYVHPCIEEHVICVGALADNATTKWDKSDFGDAVSLFAPGSIPVMRMPDDNNFDIDGPPSPQTATGTSAATAFVAGVAAMIKAINPELNSSQVKTILRETAHPGAGLVTRYLDAYAAVRRAAEGVPGVKDRLDSGPNNDLDTTPTDLSLPDFGGPSSSYDLANLNLDRIGDRDYFKFEAPANSTATIDLLFPATLGALTILNAQTSGNCTPPILINEESPSENQRRFNFRLGGGTYQFAVAGPDINAYNLSIVLAASPVDPDIYESPPPNNDTPQNARLIQTLKSTGGGLFNTLRIDPTVTISASLHQESDVDWYIVRGARMSLSDTVYLNGSPAVKVYGNDASITLEVFARKADGTDGALVGKVSGSSCTAEPLIVSPLSKDVYYLVKVTGSPGRYTLHNGVSGEKRRLPILVRDRAYEVLHPLDPITKPLQQPEFFVFVADPAAYPNIIAAGPPLHARLFDLDGNLIGEGQAQGAGERINLAGTAKNGVYALQVSPLGATAGQPVLTLEWESAAPARVSANLIRNPGAEADQGNNLPEWGVPMDGLGNPAVIDYQEDGDELPTLSDPGPTDRGLQLFAGGDNNALAGIRQTIAVDPAWQQAINEGRVKVRFSAFLGGAQAQGDEAGATLTFLNAGFQTLGTLALAPVTPLDRENQTGLLPRQATESVPAGTTMIDVDLLFTRAEGEFNNSFADNLEMILSEYTP